MRRTSFMGAVPTHETMAAQKYSKHVAHMEESLFIKQSYK